MVDLMQTHSLEYAYGQWVLYDPSLLQYIKKTYEDMRKIRRKTE
jgi:hypothetical protein